MQGTVEKYFQSIYSGGWEDFVGDDIVFIRNSLDNRLDGKAAYLKGAGTFFDTTTSVEIKQLFTDGNKVSVLARYAVQAPDGRTSTCDVAEFLEFADEKLTYSAIFFYAQALRDFMSGTNQ